MTKAKITSVELNQLRKTNSSFFSSLQSAFLQGIITSSEVQEKTHMKKEEIIKKHEENHRISQGNGKDKRWHTYLPDGSPKGKLITKTKLEDLEEVIVEFYTHAQAFTVEQLYTEWIEYKATEARSTSYVAKIKYDWCTYYKPDTAFLHTDIQKLNTIDLETWAHNLIK